MRPRGAPFLMRWSRFATDPSGLQLLLEFKWIQARLQMWAAEGWVTYGDDMEARGTDMFLPKTAISKRRSTVVVAMSERGDYNTPIEQHLIGVLFRTERGKSLVIDSGHLGTISNAVASGDPREVRGALWTVVCAFVDHRWITNQGHMLCSELGLQEVLARGWLEKVIDVVKHSKYPSLRGLVQATE